MSTVGDSGTSTPLTASPRPSNVDRAPVHVSLGVLLLRVVTTVAVLVFALTITLVVGLLHGAQMHIAALECPEFFDAAGEPVEPHRSVTWSNGSWCTYPSEDGGLGSILVGTPGPTNVFEPRPSFALAVGALAVTWVAALGLLWLTWVLGWSVHRPESGRSRAIVALRGHEHARSRRRGRR
jgi:hypothetical protein